MFQRHSMLIDDNIVIFLLRVILTIVLYFMANYHTYQIGVECNHERPLFDALHEVLPDLSRWVYVRDIVLIAYLIPFLFIVNTFDFIFDFLHYFLLIVTFKAITIFFTFIPPSHPECGDKRYLNHCFHQMLSGHNSFVFLLFLLYLKYGVFKSDMMKLGWFGGVIGYALLILMTRAHYSVDILVSFIIVFLLVEKN